MTALAPAREERVLSAADVLVGCVTENDPKYLGQTLRLVRSIRWFGGELAEVRVLVCALEAIAREAREKLARLGAEIRVVSRFSSNGSSNRLRFLEEGWGECKVMLALDCDTLVVRDPLPLMRPGLMQMKVEAMPTVTHEVFERLFEHYRLELPPRSHVTGLTRTPTIPYFNGGVMVVPSSLARRLVPVWGAFNCELAERPELAFPCERHLHQASLSLALAACQVPFEEAPVELNYQLNATHLEPPEGFRTLDPAILHYHDLVDDDGYLLPTPYPLARIRSERFNERQRTERAAPAAGASTALRAPTSGSPAELVVLGMHRAGLGAVTGLLRRMTLVTEPRDPIRPGNDPIALLDEAALAMLDASWCEVDDLDLDRLPAERRRALAERAGELLHGCQGCGAPVLADPRLCLVFPLWRPLLRRPVCLLVHRHPLSIARALQDREGLPLSVGIALWELYVRAALAGTRGLPRILVSYHDLVGAPGPTLLQLEGGLRRLGVDGLAPLEGTGLAFLDPSLDHHPREPDGDLEGDFLTPPQLELLQALESGTALTIDLVPALTAGARGTLAAHRNMLAGQRALRMAIDYRDSLIAEAETRESSHRREVSDLQELLAMESRNGEKLRAAVEQTELLSTRLRQAETTTEALDRLLGAVFASRTWRLGRFWSRLFHRLSKPAGPTAQESWQRLRETGAATGRRQDEEPLPPDANGTVR